MMKYTSRAADYLEEKEQLTALVLRYRAATGASLFPNPWRVRLLLSSRVWTPEQDPRVWEDTGGHIAAFAMLWRRNPSSPYLVLDRFVDPQHMTEDMLGGMVAWGIERAQAIQAESSGSMTLYMSRLHRETFSEPRLPHYGLARLAPNPEEHNIFFARSLHGFIPGPQLPMGHELREPVSLDDLEAYAEIYDFAAVSREHRQEMLRSQEYHQLVLADPRGRFVAYGESSFSREEWTLTGLRLGWIDYIGTRPEYRRQGLGRAVLLAMLQHLQAAGADEALLVTVSTNSPAIALYRLLGFRETSVPEAPVYTMRLSGM